MMYAATLAGIAFGNSGVHLPHGMAYSVAGLIRDYRPDGYPKEEAICPHGISVIVDAPSVVRASPHRHRRRATWKPPHCWAPMPPAPARRTPVKYLAARIIDMMRDTDMPNGIYGAGLWRRRHRRPGPRRLCPTTPARELAAARRRERSAITLSGRRQLLVNGTEARPVCTLHHLERCWRWPGGRV